MSFEIIGHPIPREFGPTLLSILVWSPLVEHGVLCRLMLTLVDPSWLGLSLFSFGPTLSLEILVLNFRSI